MPEHRDRDSAIYGAAAASIKPRSTARGRTAATSPSIMPTTHALAESIVSGEVSDHSKNPT
jgi:hypothetical protein